VAPSMTDMMMMMMMMMKETGISELIYYFQLDTQISCLFTQIALN
jgi:hypothetical protein